MKFIKMIIQLLTSFFDWKSSKNKLELNESNSESIKDLNKKKSEASDAIYNKDDDAINKILNNTILILLSLTMLGGCITKTVYVPMDRKVESIEFNGVSGKFVPDATFKIMMDRYIEWDYYYKKYGAIESGGKK